MANSIKIDCKNISVDSSRYSEYISVEVEDFTVEHVIKDLMEEANSIDEVITPIIDNYTEDFLDALNVSTILEYLERVHDIEVSEGE